MLRLSPILFDLLRYGGAVHMFGLGFGFLRSEAPINPIEAKSAPFLDEAIFLLLNPKAYLVFTQYLHASESSDPALEIWITVVFVLNNLLAVAVWTFAADFLLRRFSSAEPPHDLVCSNRIHITLRVPTSCAPVYGPGGRLHLSREPFSRMASRNVP